MDVHDPALLGALQFSFATELARTDPAAPVPGLDWSVRDLAAHLSGVHHWATGRVLGEPCNRDAHLPVPDPELADHYAARARDLREALASTDPSAQVITLIGPGPAAFWQRRQVHETLVHLVDLTAAGRAGAPLDEVDAALPSAGDPEEVPRGTCVAPRVWADGVDEVLTMFLPRQVRKGRCPDLGTAVRLEATDTGDVWTLGPQTAPPAGAAGKDAATAEAPRTSAEPVASVTGAARDLALLLWKRTPLDGGQYRLDGNEAAIREVLSLPLAP